MPAGKTSFEKGGIQFNIGDQVLVQQAPHELHPFVAKIEKISVDQVNGGHELGITWYYRPEDTARRPYHGERELFMSDHKDTINSQTVMSKCIVWSLEEYRQLKTVTSTDYYARYTWHTAQKRYSPEHVPVWCSCELPENPDLAMAECDRCLNWYHFACEGESAEAVAQGGAYICRRCRRAMSNGVLVEPSAAGYIAGPPRP